MLVIGIGCDVDAPDEEVQNARELARNAPSYLMGQDSRISPTPNAIEDWSDVSKVGYWPYSVLNCCPGNCHG